MSNDVTGVDRPFRVGQVWVRKKDGDVAVYEPSTRELHLMNPSALAIWELCDGETSLQEIADAIGELTSATREQALRDVTATARKLYSIGLISATEPS